MLKETIGLFVYRNSQKGNILRWKAKSPKEFTPCSEIHNGRNQAAQEDPEGNKGKVQHI